MKRSLNISSSARVGFILFVSIVVIPNSFAQPAANFKDNPEAAQRAQYQEKLQHVLDDKAAYIAALVQRWENSARESGRWDENFAADLSNALTKLQPDNLLAAGEAPSYDAMMGVMATGQRFDLMMSGGRAAVKASERQSQAILPAALGDIANDLVYTPVVPCRIVDTRNAGGVISANTARSFDVDGGTFLGQGGVNGSCGIPFGVARAVAMTLTVTQPSAGGFFTAWAVGSPQPLSSVINFAAGQTIANTTIVPVVPGGGPDFNLFVGGSTAHVITDVVGYFAAPAATALDCITVSSAVTPVGVNVWTAVDASCPLGRTATGGGYDVPEGTLGFPGVWINSQPNGNGWRTWVDNQTNGNRNVQTSVRCCRLPGR